MEINNFTDIGIRLGEFPFSVDVKNIDTYHSNHGVVCTFYNGKGACGDIPRVLIIKNANNVNFIHVVTLKWDEQLDALPKEIRDGEVIYDSF